MEDKRIHDSQLTVSSQRTWTKKIYYHGAINARLNHWESNKKAGGWRAGIDDSKQWIQVNLRAVMWVSGVMTQGRNSVNHLQWVTGFRVQYRRFDTQWTFVKTHTNQTVRVITSFPFCRYLIN